MNKAELVAEIAKNTGLTKVDSEKATEGRNPRTGETIKIPASKQPKFKAGKGLKDALN